MTIYEFRNEMMDDVRSEVRLELLDLLVRKTKKRLFQLTDELEVVSERRNDKFQKLCNQNADALAFKDWAQVFNEREASIKGRILECDEFLGLLRSL